MMNKGPKDKGVISSPSKLEGARGSVSYPISEPEKNVSYSSSKSEKNVSDSSSESEKRSVSKRTKNTPEMKQYRRELRNHSTTAEKVLWKLIKGKQIEGLRFRRQFSIGNYILDFYCPSLQLAIELDGEYHNDEHTFEKDQTRVQMLLDKYHIQTLRFENKIVLQQPETIINSIILFRNNKMAMTSTTSSSQNDTLPLTPSNLEGEKLPLQNETSTDGERFPLQNETSIDRERLPLQNEKHTDGEFSIECSKDIGVISSPSKLEGVRGSVLVPSEPENVVLVPSESEKSVSEKSVPHPKAIIFDFGGVVVTLDHPQAVEKFRRLGLEDAAQRLDPYTQGGIFGQLERGLLTAEEFIAELSQLCHRTLTYNDCLDAWLGYRKELPQRNLDALVRLRKEGYRLILLSNTNPFMMHWASSPDFDGKGHPVEAYFDAVYLSYQMGVMKPDERFFRRVLEDQHLQPEEALFLDDGPRNVAAASRLGIQTLCPENGADWTQQLFSMLSIDL